MRTVSADRITEAVERLCINANCDLNRDVEEALVKAYGAEKSEIGRNVLKQLIENARLAREKNMAICQDTGMAVVFVELGQDVQVTGGDISEAIIEGVRRGYRKGCLRQSVVADPIERVNTGDNTPAVIHYELVKGDRLKICVAPKGFGSENMSALGMLKPSDGLEGVKRFVIDTVDAAGPNPCPPLLVGVGIGGTMEKAALLAKKALLRPIGEPNPRESLDRLEKELLSEINRLGVGPAGLGGTVTALAVHIEVFPTHIAGLPVAVNISCHAIRHAEAEL